MTPSSMQRQLLQRLAPHAHPSRALRPARRPPSQHRAPSTAHAIQLLRRSFSTGPRPRQQVHASPTTADSTTPPPLTAQVNTAGPPKWGRWVSATIFLLLGALAGTALKIVVQPPPPPPPRSSADEALAKDVRAQAQKLPIVQQLIAEPGWTHHEAYSAFPASTKLTRITSGPLGSSSGVGAYQHIFHPPPSSPFEPIINVLFIGLSTSGWPGVVHGGLLSTILDEHSARAALAETAGKGVLTANLDLSYRQPTLAGGFYVVKARALRDEELDEREKGKRDRKIWVDVWLETMEGAECLRGRALFVIPKGRELRGLEKGF